MAWLSFLNPANWVKILSLLKFFWEGIAKIISDFQEAQAEKKASKEDKEKSEKALEEFHKPQDPSKSVEQRRQDAENAADHFRDSFK